MPRLSQADKNAYARAWRSRNRDKVLDNNLRVRYGIRLTDYNRMLDEQGGCCAICGTREWGRKGPHVDHNHETGEVRGILCSGCNTGLGQFHEDPNRMRLAIRYLETK